MCNFIPKYRLNSLIAVILIGIFSTQVYAASDLFWYNIDTGATSVWHMNGTQIVSVGSPPGLADLSFSPGSAGDYNGDGKTDLMWRSQSKGQSRIWLLDGETRSASSAIPNIDSNWEVEGSGDFDGDGKDDLMWRHSTMGQNRAWLLNGTSRKDSSALPNLLDTNWIVGGIGDFDGDNKDDILWRNTQLPRNRIWLMNGFSKKNSNAIPNLQNNWEVAGIGDFDGDGDDDILWRDQSNGQNRIWLMAGLIRANSNAAPNLDSAWIAGDVRDFDGDGKDDIAWRNTSNGQNRIWLMDGFLRKQGASVQARSNSSWQIVGSTSVGSSSDQSGFSLSLGYVSFVEGDPGVEDDFVYVSAVHETEAFTTTEILTANPKVVFGQLVDNAEHEGGITITVYTYLPAASAYSNIWYEFGYLGTDCLVRIHDNDAVFVRSAWAETSYYSNSTLSDVSEDLADGGRYSSGISIVNTSGCGAADVTKMFFNGLAFRNYSQEFVEIDAVLVEAGRVEDLGY